APIFVRSTLAMDVVAVVGLVTALFAATIGLLQTDIKKVLAYSTVSQLGYMFLALGCGGFGAGIFHLMTHAFFKGLLFLGAGSVIHAMSGEQDMRKMGALAGKIPITFATFVIGALALGGTPPLAGFFSKDEILLHVYERSPVLYALGVFTAFLTAFYIFRAVFLTFFGPSRRSEEADHHLHESPAIMTVPLMILAGLSAGGGFLAIDRWLTPIFAGVTPEARIVHGFETVLMALSVAAGLAGIALAYLLYIARPQWSDDLAEAAGELHRFILNKYYVDEIYGAVIVRPLLAISSQFLWRVLDAGLIDGA